MKKVMLFLMLSVYALGSSGFSNSNLSKHTNYSVDDDCFQTARIGVLVVYGEINIDNIDVVLWLTAQCEMNAPVSYFPWDGN